MRPALDSCLGLVRWLSASRGPGPHSAFVAKGSGPYPAILVPHARAADQRYARQEAVSSIGQALSRSEGSSGLVD
jgi:hypothetical protein